MRALMLLLLLAANAVALAEVYRHVDAEGRVTLTDTPPDGSAVPVTLPPVNTVPGNVPQPPAAAAETAAKPAARRDYELLRVVGIGTGTVLQNPQTPVTLMIELRPNLQDGDQLRLLHNGRASPASAGTPITLDGLPRGQHTFGAEVVDAEGVVLIQGGTLEFTVLRPSLNMPSRH